MTYGFLTAADRADMLASLTQSWTQTATIQRNPGDDNWYTIANGVPCRATASQATEVIVAGELRAIIPWKISMPQGTDVSTRDRITIAGRTFQVEGIIDPLDANLIRQLQAVEVGA